MTYRELINKLNTLPSHKLDDDVSIYCTDEEFYSLQHIAASNDNGILDDGCIYLSVDEILFEDDESIE